MALQEFIDALQVLILLLPADPRVLEGSSGNQLAATLFAMRRTLTSARQLHARLVALRENRPGSVESQGV